MIDKEHKNSDIFLQIENWLKISSILQIKTNQNVISFIPTFPNFFFGKATEKYI